MFDIKGTLGEGGVNPQLQEGVCVKKTIRIVMKIKKSKRGFKTRWDYWI